MAKKHEIAAAIGKAGLGMVQGASETLLMGWQKENAGPKRNLNEIADKKRAAVEILREKNIGISARLRELKARPVEKAKANVKQQALARDRTKGFER